MTERRRIVTAIILWVVLAFLVWNVIFDRILVLAGRRYSYDATLAFRAGHYLRIDDVMRPAVTHGVRVASLWAGALLVAGLVLIRVAAARDARRRGEERVGARSG